MVDISISFFCDVMEVGEISEICTYRTPSVCFFVNIPIDPSSINKINKEKFHNLIFELFI